MKMILGVADESGRLLIAPWMDLKSPLPVLSTTSRCWANSIPVLKPMLSNRKLICLNALFILIYPAAI